MSAKKGNTPEKIRTVAKNLFLKNGFQNTSVQQISHEIGITSQGFYKHFSSKEEVFSCLVQPVVNKIRDIMHFEVDEKNKLILKKEYQQAWNKERIMTQLLDYIYENFDSVKLLVCCSAGSKYENIIDQVSEFESDVIMETLPILKKNGVDLSKIDEQTIRLIMKHQYRLFTEFIYDDYSKEQAEKFINSANEFYVTAWRNYFQF